MPRKYTEQTLKQLFARSWNRCSFLGCGEPFVQPDQVIIGEICHITSYEKKGPRYDASLTPKQRNSPENLIVLCRNHHKLVDSDPLTYTVARLQKMKSDHENASPSKVTDLSALRALISQLSSAKVVKQSIVNSPGAIQAETLNVFTHKQGTIKVSAPGDSISFSAEHRNYVLHLIERYNKFAFTQKNRLFKHGAIYGIIKRTFGAKWDLNAMNKFESICIFLQSKIDSTIVGKQNKAQLMPNYSSFENFKSKGL